MAIFLLRFVSKCDWLSAMANPEKTAQRDAEREEVLGAWASKHQIRLHRLDAGQQWVVFSALQLVAILGDLAPLKRLVAYVLAHSGMGLSAPIIAAVTGVSDRAIRTTKSLEPEQLLHSIRTKPGGRGSPKIGPEYAGPLARFLVDNPGSTLQEILSFIQGSFDISVDPSTVHRYLNRYGMGCLRNDSHTDAPLF